MIETGLALGAAFFGAALGAAFFGAAFFSPDFEGAFLAAGLASLASAAGFFSASVLAQANVDQITEEGVKRADAGAAEQRRVEQIANQTADLLNDYNTVSKVVDGLVTYNSLLQRQVNNQESEMQALAESIDNVALIAYEFVGPAISTREIALAQDNFPEIGAIDPGNPAANHVRFDMANNISLVDHLRNDPGDSLVFDCRVSRVGAALTGRPHISYTLKRNPIFDPYRTSGLPDQGFVLCDSVRNAAGRWVTDRFYADLGVPLVRRDVAVVARLDPEKEMSCFFCAMQRRKALLAVAAEQGSVVSVKYEERIGMVVADFVLVSPQAAAEAGTADDEVLVALREAGVAFATHLSNDVGDLEQQVRELVVELLLLLPALELDQLLEPRDRGARLVGLLRTEQQRAQRHFVAGYETKGAYREYLGRFEIHCLLSPLESVRLTLAATID